MLPRLWNISAKTAIVVGMNIVILDSAHKHGISDYSINMCIFNKIADELLDDEPEKRFIAGFDQNGSALEIIGIMKGDTFIVIHAKVLESK
ncbi:MAG: hypothetical protein Ta2B_30200 [Termitinemataceae bacterium]|nr:MAG: hypothetical protein Ta2B_30200 [Termitinemataceae bacterium]